MRVVLVAKVVPLMAASAAVLAHEVILCEELRVGDRVDQYQFSWIRMSEVEILI